MGDDLNIDYVNIIYINLPFKIRATSTENVDGGYTIFVNKNLTYEIQVKAIKHEMWHIVADDFNNDKSIETIEMMAHAV